MLLEFHDGEVDNATHGTLNGTVGKEGTVEYAYQAEIYVQEYLDGRIITRVYAIGNGCVYAVWSQRGGSEPCYVGRRPEYNGEWQLPDAYPGATKLVTGMLGREVRSREVAEQWATTQLQQPDVASAIVLDDDGLVCAWERGDTNPVLVAWCPRPLPVPHPAAG